MYTKVTLGKDKRFSWYSIFKHRPLGHFKNRKGFSVNIEGTFDVTN
jgi:hypothetical protein